MFLGGWVRHVFLALTYFCSSYIYRIKNKRLKTCDVCERSIYNELWNLVVLRIRKESLLCGFGYEENPKEGQRQWKKKNTWVENGNCFKILCERKNILTILKWLKSFLRHKKCQSRLQKWFWKCRPSKKIIYTLL